MYFATGVAESLRQAGPGAFGVRYRKYFHRELSALPESLAAAAESA